LHESKKPITASTPLFFGFLPKLLIPALHGTPLRHASKDASVRSGKGIWLNRATEDTLRNKYCIKPLRGRGARRVRSALICARYLTGFKRRSGCSDAYEGGRTSR